MTLLLVVFGIAYAIWHHSTRQMALVSAVLFIAYFVLPWGLSVGWVQVGWINERLLFLTILTLPAWIILPRPAIATTLFLIAIAAHIGRLRCKLPGSMRTFVKA